MKRLIGCLLCFVCCMPVAWAQQKAGTKPKATISAITFPGILNLPAWIAQRQGFFDKHGVVVNLTYTPNSTFALTNVIAGKFDVAITGIDNLIAYQEGQVATALPATPDLAAFMGVTRGFIYLVASPDIKRIADLRGKTLAVDALSTGFAFVLREMIARAGMGDADVIYVPVGGSNLRLRALLENKQAATLLNTPFAEQAAERGYTVLGSGSEMLGEYLGHAAFTQRAWLKQNEAAAIAMVRAYRDAMEWLFDPRNREIAEALIVANDAGVSPALARRAYDAAVNPKSGMYRNVALSLEGLKTVLALRSKFASPPKTLDDPMKYVDLDLYRKAFGTGQ
ncbi:MAG: ABC transporter substrate-binding protein [Burkholderiales bacterium]